MSDKIGIDLNFNPSGNVEAELGSLAIALHQLYGAAAKAWPGQKLWRCQRVGGGVFTVELEPAPQSGQSIS